eukprot:scaffold14195_cov65-Cyclotella_meneghiniana.AAC.3
METVGSPDTQAIPLHSRTPFGQNNRAFAFVIVAFGLTIFAADYINLRSTVSHHFRTETIVQSASDSTSHRAAEQATLRASAVIQTKNSESPKPVMTTFFEPVEGGCCGMTQQAHDNLVSSWSRAWQDHGWITRILTEADAKRHPRFELFQRTLIDANVNEYDIRCFWRWLAMSLDDNPMGGWMSDYDLFPLTLTGDKGKELMKQPGFKTYGGQVPALIHADASSWERIVQMMIENVKPDMDISFISDMMVLLYLHDHYSEEQMGVTTWEFDLWKKFPYKRVPGQQYPVIDCELVKNHLAAHLSHRAAQEAHEVTHTYPHIGQEVKKGEYVEYRAQAADVMMNDMKQCMEPSVA